jgi:hypothetical protein
LRYGISWGGSTTDEIAAGSTAAQVGTLLNSLDTIAATGGVSVTGPLGGPFRVTWLQHGSRDILKFETNDNSSIIAAREVAGSNTTYETQMWCPTYKTIEVELDSTYGGNLLKVYWSNPLVDPTQGTTRAPYLRDLAVRDNIAKLWEVTDGLVLKSVDLTQNPPAAGGWSGSLDVAGVATTSSEEIKAYELTGSTQFKNSSLSAPAGVLDAGPDDFCLESVALESAKLELTLL